MFAIPYPAIDPVLLQIGPIAIRWYALSYIFGILIGWWYARRLVSNDSLWGPGGSVITKRHLADFVVWVTIGIVAGGRLGYVILYDLPSFFDRPLSIFEIWNGGMSFHGAFIGTALAMYFFARSQKIPVWSLIDIVTTVAPIALFLGRLANFINGELYGRASDVAWAMVFPNDPLQVPRHPSQLYEALLEGAVLFAILWLLVHRAKWLRTPGLITGAFTAGYGTFRTFVEFFREPDAQLGFLSGGLTMGMLLSIPMIIAGLGLIAWKLRQRPAPAGRA